MSAIFDKSELKVAIVGSAPASKMNAPYLDESWEIWGLSKQFHWMPRWTRWFELHTAQHISNRGKEYSDWLISQEKPVYLQADLPEMGNALKFPRTEFLQRYGDYVTNSISWMLGFALMEGAREIALYGVDMAFDTEYGYERPNVEYFIGWARGAGVSLYVPPESPICKSRGLYGLESETGAYPKLVRGKQKEIEEALEKSAAQRKDAEMNMAFYKGATEMLNWVKQWA